MSHENICRRFHISSNGFLPERAPLRMLPDPYYAPWEKIIQHLPALLADKRLRQGVDEMPVLVPDRLKTVEEWQRAYVIFGFLAHAYIWGEDEASQVRFFCTLLSNMSKVTGGC